MSEKLKEYVEPFAIFLAMIEAHCELIGETLPDSDVIAHFMGSGASMQLTIGHLRNLRDAMEEK